MFRKLLPQEHGYFDLFEQHAMLGLKACQELQALFAEDGDMTARTALIKDLEREADLVTRSCMDALHRTFITPMDRSDIQTLIQRLDDVVDSVESIAVRVMLYEIAEVRPEARALADILVECAKETTLLMPLLRNMKNADAIKQHCVKIFDMENEGDLIMRNALAKLFKTEKDAIVLIKWKELYERLEKATDRCEAVASIVQSIVIEAS
jgi:predicted phosphate transport protein (TIGR00153 family)